MKTALTQKSVRSERRVASGAKAASSAIFGSAVTLGLFLVVAHFGHEPAKAPVEVDDLRTVYAPIEPPPPPPQEQTTEVPPDTTITGFDPAPSDSSVKITVLPPDLEQLLPPPPVAPPAKIELNHLYTEFKPKLSIGKFEQRIYQMSDVDQLPYVLNHVIPDIPRDLLHDLESLHVVVLAVIELDGTPHDLRIARSSGNPEFDQLMMESIAQWTFAPAVRKGKKVRCLVSQDTHFKKSHRSLLQLQ
jgi:TonB family protein